MHSNPQAVKALTDQQVSLAKAAFTEARADAVTILTNLEAGEETALPAEGTLLESFIPPMFRVFAGGGVAALEEAAKQLLKTGLAIAVTRIDAIKV